MVSSGSRISVDGGEVWFKVVGSGGGTPLLAVHGIPGTSSQYLEGLGALGDDRRVVFYDQLGGGRSDRPADAGLWTLGRFVAELTAVRAALGLSRVHLFGHSWGGMLVVDHALADSAGISSLVLSSAPLSIARYVEDIRRLRDGLPPPVLDALVRHERDGTVSSAAYLEAVTAFRQRHTYVGSAWPDEFVELLTSINPDVFVAIWGADPFACTGVARHYERTLRPLTMPILLTVGAHDATTPAAAEAYAETAPNARLHVFQASAHMAMLEEPEQFVSVVRQFLREVDGSRSS